MEACDLKKLFLAIVFLTLLTGQAFAAKVFTTTIQDTTVAQVRDAAISYMMDKNFAIDRVEDYTITFTKGFGDGVWIEFRNMTVIFNVVKSGDNVKLMVTQMEDSKVPFFWGNTYSESTYKGQRNIEHLIPLIKDIRHSIDGTPLDQIVNEAKEDGAREEEKKPKYRDSGLYFEGNKITKIDENSIADSAGLKTGDLIIEIGAKPVDGDLKKQIDQKLLAGRSVIVTYERDGNKDVLTMKQN
jgi:hypothetical protein